MKHPLASLLAPWLGAAVLASPAAAASVESFVMTVGGQSMLIPPFGCSTYAVPAPVTSFFGVIGSSVPVDGLGTCQVAGSIRHQVAAAGPISDTSTLNVAFNTHLPSHNTFQGTAAGAAQSGVLAASATALFTGPSNSAIVQGATAFGKFSDSFTLTSASVANGTAGMLVFGVTLAGALHSQPTLPSYAMSAVELRYQLDAGPVYNLFRAQHDGSNPFATGTAGSASTVGDVLSGFTLGARSISGAGQVYTYAMPFVFGTPFDFTLGLAAWSAPGRDGAGQVDFSAWVSRIAASVGGVPVTDFGVVAASGTPYGSGGVLPVPELPPAWLLAVGALFLSLCRSRPARR